MNQVGFALLSIMVFLPTLVGLAILGLSFVRQDAGLARLLALASSLLSVALGLWLYFGYDQTAQGQPFQFVEDAPWIPQIGITYHLGVDALSMFLVLLTAVVTALVVLFAGPEAGERAADTVPWLYRLLLDKYYVDEAYDGAVVRPALGIARFIGVVFDRRLLDGVVRGVAAGLGALGDGLRTVQTGYVRQYLLSMLVGVVVIVAFLLTR